MTFFNLAGDWSLANLFMMLKNNWHLFSIGFVSQNCPLMMLSLTRWLSLGSLVSMKMVELAELIARFETALDLANIVFEGSAMVLTIS